MEQVSGSAVEGRVDPAVALRTAHTAIDDLLAADWAGSSDEELLDALRGFEALRRRMSAVDHALVLEAEGRRLPEALAYRNVAGLLRAVLRLDPREAAGRVRAADAAGVRRTLTGEPLEPAYPVIAAAQAAGEISARHAAVIVRTLEQLPDDVRHEHGVEIEAELVGHGQRFDADDLAKIARRLRYLYDQDGPCPDGEAYRARTRDFRISQRPDGSAHGEFEATGELAELLLTHIDALAAPRPERDGVKDPRTAGQRRHDALLESLKLVTKARLLPSVNGVTATVVVTMTARQYQTGQGLARTAHGALVPVSEALRWGSYGGDLRLLAMAIGTMKPVEAYGTTVRLHNETQRLVLHAVHPGCTFPGCGLPPPLTQIHHVLDYAHGGETSVNNGAPVCGKDHRDRINQGWHAQIIGTRIAWIPPPSIDPQQQPRYNELHQPLLGADHDDEPEDRPDG
jgi:uncharacterized protein DUF222